MDSKFLTYRGEVKALIALGGTVAFVTVHPEGQPTALYRLDVEKLQLLAEQYPCGGIGLAGNDGGLWVLGTDGKVHRASVPIKGVTGWQSSGPITLLSRDRLAFLRDTEIVIQ